MSVECAPDLDLGLPPNHQSRTHTRTFAVLVIVFCLSGFCSRSLFSVWLLQVVLEYTKGVRLLDDFCRRCLFSCLVSVFVVASLGHSDRHAYYTIILQ